MSNLFKYEFRKILHSKLFYICIALCIGFIFISYGTIKLLSYSKDLFVDSVPDDSYGELEPMFNYSSITALLGGISSSSIGLVGAIFISIYISEDYRNGVIKNIYGRGYSRTKVYLTKYLVSLAALVLFALASLLFAFILGRLFFENNVDAPSNIVFNLITQVFVVIAYHAIFFAITMSIRKFGFVILFNIIGMTLLDVIVALIDAGFNNVFVVDFSIQKYWLGSFLSNLSDVSIATTDILICFILSIIYGSIAVCIGYIFSHKRDV